MIDVERFLDRSSSISFESEDLRRAYASNGLRMLRHSSNIPHKTSFEVKSCHVGDIFLDECFEFLEGNKFIDTIVLSDLATASTRWTRPLCRYLKNSYKLRHLDLQGSKLSKADLEDLSSAIIACESIKSLNLSRVGINKNSAPYVVSIMLCHAALESISLRGQGMVPTELLSILELLPRCASLRSVDLGQNPLDLETARAFASALSADTCKIQIQSIDLSCSSIDDSILQTLIPGLQTKQRNCLEYINLSGNFLSDHSLPLLLELVNWDGLKGLLLSGNSLSSGALDAIRAHSVSCAVYI